MLDRARAGFEQGVPYLHWLRKRRVRLTAVLLCESASGRSYRLIKKYIELADDRRRTAGG
uniref:Uncharacterized protein n=1 Tax=Setaria viridis TaxID=4556 RepID=A0A4U6TKG9_SETVI|nr:hypothetical protein SEVIR_9G522566v2 [Setaria viridis]